MMRKVLFLAMVILASYGVVRATADNYAVTVGSGTTFGSLLSGGINFAKMLICDFSSPATQCASVSAGGAVKTDSSATTQPVSIAGTVTTSATGASNVTCISGCSGVGTQTTSGTGVQSMGITQWAATNLGAPSAYGTSPGAVNVPGVNAFVTNANANGQATMANSAPVVIASNQTVLTVNTSANNVGGWTPTRVTSLTSVAVQIKGSGGQLGKVYCSNPNSSVACIQIFNSTSASVTVGTTASIPYCFPATSAGGYAMSPMGDQYSTGISVAATTTAIGVVSPTIGLDCNVSSN